MHAQRRPEVILVHGLWFGSWAMSRLANRLGRKGFTVRRINYRTTRGDLAEHAQRLQAFAALSTAPTQHFVGHSLGGLVILKLFSTGVEIPPGRLVFLGSPLKGSRVARKAAAIPGAATLFGKIRTALDDGYSVVPDGRDVGMIAGSKSAGLGWLVGGTGGPGDGTVAVAETMADGLTDHCLLPVTHTSMIFSARVAEQAAYFLENGRFMSGPA